MSIVTNILLCTAPDDGGIEDGDNPNAERLSAWLTERHGAACALKRLDVHAAGNKRMEADVYGVAVNMLDADALLEAFRSIKWGQPSSVQMLLKEQGDDAFRLYSPQAESEPEDAAS